MTKLQVIDDAFAIHLGFLLSDTVVIVHCNSNLENVSTTVETYLNYFEDMLTRDIRVAIENCGIVRKTSNLFIVVNFGFCKVDFNEKSFLDWTKKKDFTARKENPEAMG